VLKRWYEKDVAAGGLLGLATWTWQRGRPGDGGMIGDYWRPANDGLQVELSFSPGIFVGGGMPEYRQTLYDVRLTRGEQAVPFAELDAIHASEIIRDLDNLAPARDLP